MHSSGHSGYQKQGLDDRHVQIHMLHIYAHMMGVRPIVFCSEVHFNPGPRRFADKGVESSNRRARIKAKWSNGNVENNKLCGESAANNWNGRLGGILISSPHIANLLQFKSQWGFPAKFPQYLAQILEANTVSISKNIIICILVCTVVYTWPETVPFALYAGWAHDDPGPNWGQGGP